jgi:hypothetical protein
MALGDIDEITEKPDFLKASNNGDLKKVIATIFGIGIDFFKQYPNSVVHFLGNEARKTKFYHRIIANNLEEFSQFFKILVFYHQKKWKYLTLKVNITHL